MILKHLWSFSGNPKYIPYQRVPSKLKVKILAYMVLWNLILGIGLAVLAEGVFVSLGLDTGKHSINEMFSKYTLPKVFLLMVVLAPLIEELVFRAPLVFFRKSPYFSLIFYFSCLVFGLVHLGNFEDSDALMPWTPLLVAPQILMGFFLGFLRVKLGLKYAILMHACHNGLIFLLISIPGL